MENNNRRNHKNNRGEKIKTTLHSVRTYRSMMMMINTKNHFRNEQIFFRRNINLSLKAFLFGFQKRNRKRKNSDMVNERWKKMREGDGEKRKKEMRFKMR